MAAYASVGDVQTRLDVEFNVGQHGQVTALLEDVSAIMRARLPQLDTWIAVGKTDADLAKGIACWLAMQAVTVVTTGVGIGSETHPEYSVRITDAASAGLDLSDAQRSQLTPDTSEQAFSVRPGSD